MNFWGKIVGGLFGYWTLGPIGLILGVLIGHRFDKALEFMKNTGSSFGPMFFFNVGIAQKTFFHTTFSVMGHIAKADGHVSEREIQMARTIMQRMRLSPEMKQEAIRLFNEGKRSTFNLLDALKRLRIDCRGNQTLLQMFVEIQIQAAQADGPIDAIEKRILTNISQILGVHVNFMGGQQQYSYQQQGQGSRQRTYSNLDNAYRELGISSSASDAEVKKAYRKLMSENHPDKLVAKGLPEEMIKLANEKTSKIRKAYEAICQSRGMK